MGVNTDIECPLCFNRNVMEVDGVFVCMTCEIVIGCVEPERPRRGRKNKTKETPIEKQDHNNSGPQC